ncbi:MAG TPA: isochorismatase family cysteine hydrolase [Blastocatellia bacterium]|nr:isochorismatase family cysteine hydrolase [Blastocatellia bacterium]
MNKKNRDLYGNAPDKSKGALLLIDVINDLEFEGAELLHPHFLKVAKRIQKLKSRVKESGIPVVYVNDNFGRWQSDFNKILDHCLHDGVCGQEIAEMLKPDPDDYFVLKPKHSGFFSTTLDTLLEYLEAETLIITGVAGDICILFTANDAYMRDFKLFIPADCVASNDEDENDRVLKLMERVLKADIRDSDEIDLKKLARESTNE